MPRRFRKHPLGPAVGMTRSRVFFETLSRRTRTCGEQDASLSFVCNIAASHATKLPIVPQRDLVAGTARQRGVPHRQVVLRSCAPTGEENATTA